MRNFYAVLVGNKVFANVLLLIIVVVGVQAAFSMPRESLPNISSRSISIGVPYPGADPEEVEEGVSRKVNAVLDGMQGVKQYLTVSGEGFSSVDVEVADGYTVEEVKDRIRNAVDAIDSFPADVRRPRVSQQIMGEEVMLVAVSGDLPERQLKELAAEVREELQDDPEVSLAQVIGARAYEVAIEVSEEQLRKHGLTLSDVSRAVMQSSLNLSAGSLRSKGEEMRIRTMGRKYTGPEFASIVVKASPEGEVVTLDQVATIRDGFVEYERYSDLNGQPCVILSIQKATGEDTIVISEAVKRYVAEKQAALPEGVRISVCFDQTEFIRGQISILLYSGLIGLCLIVFILWLFLDARLSFWVTMGIPISLAGAMIIMVLLGSSINQVTLIAMIVVMGIIVDDAIVVGEAIYVQRKGGKSPLDAAVDGVREVGLPVIASVTTTMVAFLPMAFVTGMFGRVFVHIPYAVLSALAISLVECLFLLPAHLNHRAKKEDPERKIPKVMRLKRSIGKGLEWFVENGYGPLVRLAVRHRYITMCAAISLLMMTVGLLQGGFVKFIMWPPVEGDMIRSHIEFPPGTPREVVFDAVRQTREAIERVAARTTTESGEPLIQNVWSSAPYRNDTSGRVLVMMLATERRGVSSDGLLVEWEKEVGTITGALEQSFEGGSVGVGGNKDVAIWLQGKDLGVLRAAAEDLKEQLRSYQGVYQISDSFRPGKKELQVTLKPEASSLGLTLNDLARHLQAGYYGEETVRIQRGREDMRVWVRYPEEERQTLAKLERVRIRTPRGFEVPFLSVAEVTFAEGVSAIRSRNGVPGVVVSAAVDRVNANPREVNEDLTEVFIPKLLARHPGVDWELSGAEQMNRETLSSLNTGYVVALLGIFTILATIFKSYVQPLIIMVVIPFGTIGAIFGHLLLGLPLSFLSLFGIVALAGVLVNDSIVLIERVNTLLAEGMPLVRAVEEGGKRRFRAIFLTSISTCAGVSPLILGRNLQAQLVIPMAVSLAAGVAFGTVVTLILNPAFLLILNDARRLVRRVMTGRWPTPEEVEPNTRRNGANGLSEVPAQASHILK